MSSAAERFLAEFGGDWDYKAALKASSKASAAAPFRLESLAQPEAAGNVAANPVTPEQNADLKARRDLEDEIAMVAMLREDEDDTEGSEGDDTPSAWQPSASSASTAAAKAPATSQAAESQAAVLPPWRLPESQAAVPTMPQAAVPSMPESQAADDVLTEEATANAKARALALYKAAQQEISHGASGSPEDKKAYDAVEHSLALEHHVRWQDRGPRGENAPQVWHGQRWRKQLHSEKGSTGRFGNRGGDPAKNAHFAEQAKKRKASEQQNSKSGKGASGDRGYGSDQGNKGKGTNISHKGKGDRILVSINVSCFLHLLNVRIVIWFCWSPSLQL
jgi:hypothetical protein